MGQDLFDDIRPYRDGEVPDAMKRIASSDFFALLAAYVFPDRSVEDVREMVASIGTVWEFQHKVMYYVNEQVIRRSISELTYEGVDSLDKGAAHLFVANHRDIMLDASLLQNILVDNGMDTSEITFGANLMSPQLVVDIGRSNKMFRVERGGSPKDFYNKSRHLSDYIRQVIVDKGASVWIAQRNGRTKDGNDRTDQGIIKMFGMSQSNDKVRALASENIVPVAVSYEWEPCDVQKALELYQSRSQKYVKKPGEDISSILSGITSFKGRVHYCICPRITESDLQAYDSLTKVEFNRAVASLIDSRIFKGYRLYPNNFIAHDIRYGSRHFHSRYTSAQKKAFEEHMKILDTYDVDDMDALRDIFLGIYSNPVDNCL